MAQLFAALDHHLRTTRTRLEDAWAAAVAGDKAPLALHSPRSSRNQQQHQQHPGPAPPADPAALARFLRPRLPSASAAQLTYLAALVDLDGDGLVFPDDVVMAFEEIGTTIDTPASKVRRWAR